MTESGVMLFFTVVGVTATDIEFAVDPILVSSLDTDGRAWHILLS
jgi:hypothetical protein